MGWNFTKLQNLIGQPGILHCLIETYNYKVVLEKNFKSESNQAPRFNYQFIGYTGNIATC